MENRRFLVWPFLMLALLSGGLWSATLPQTAKGSDSEGASPVVVRIAVKDRDHLGAVAGELDIWEWHPTKGYAVAAIRPDQLQWLEELGYAPEVDAEKSAHMLELATLDPRYYYFDDYEINANGRYVVDFLQDVHLSHPGLTELVDIGDAWLAGQPGEYHRDIWVLRITNEDPAFGDITEKPVFFLFATMHAREVAVPELAIRYIKYLLEGYGGEGGYGQDPDVTWLLDHNVAYVLVMQNPDGHWKNEQNTANDRRKNLNSSDGCLEPLAWGVDLNRNHSFLWGCCGGSSGSPCSATFRGSSAGSEPETQAFQAYFATVMPDQNGPNGDNEIAPAAPEDTSGIFASLHSYGDLVLWPWYLPPNPRPPNADQMEAIGRKLAAFNGYDPSGDIWYTVDGATDDWTYGKFGVPSFTLEVGPSSGACGGFFPAYGCIEGIGGTPRSFWAENKPVLLYLHKIARTPYMTAYGPDAENVVAVPGAVAPGDLVTLTATLSDVRYETDPRTPVVAAEYFVGAPGEDGTGTPLMATDGAWADENEEVEAVFDTAGLGLGRHYVLVHGQNENGDWGPFSAAFVYVVDPAISPTIEGYIDELGSGAPLQATVTANAFTTTSDPATGHYSMTVISDTYRVTAVAAGHAPGSVSGVALHDYQAHRQDFSLEPLCTILEDDVESGNLGWTAETPWAITDEASYSPSHSWTDSPGGAYGNSRSVSLTSPLLDLSGYENVTLGFRHIYDLETGYDYGYVEYSTDGGTIWAQAAAFSGYGQTTWMEETIPIPALEDQAQARFRFRLYSDASLVADGWHVDDVALSGVVEPCVSLSGVSINGRSTGLPGTYAFGVTYEPQGASVPISFAWDNGDSASVSTRTLTVGLHTLTVTATNCVDGMVTGTHVITIGAPTFWLYGPVSMNDG
jgi:hypothetical protein